MSVYYLAIDLGASSGRHILGHVEEGKIVLEEMYRFDNVQIRKNGCDCWNLEELYRNILEGLKICGASGKIPFSLGIDTWAVDYVLTDERGRLCCDPVAYRDRRTDGMDEKVSRIISPEKLYARTGIQKQIFNTIYQLTAQKEYHPEELSVAKRFLMIPDYLNFLLTGKMSNEYTNATSTGMVNARTKTWDRELIRRLGFSQDMFGELKMPGTFLGMLAEDVQKEVGFDCRVVLPATHDTGSAFLAVPARDDRSVYLSSGTWSLLGVENEEPITTKESWQQNFTNEGGYQYRFRYLKNIMGLWMIQSVRRELNDTAYVRGKKSGSLKEGRKCSSDAGSAASEVSFSNLGETAGNEAASEVSFGDPSEAAGNEAASEVSFGDLSEAARNAAGYQGMIDVNDDRFLSPESMTQEIKAACAENGQPVPQNIGEVMQCVYLSLSKCYADAIQSLSALTGKNYTSIHIVGGGCQDEYLNELTAKAAGLPVYAGPVEGTALGNLLVQMIQAGEFHDLPEARNAVRSSFEIREIGI